jgi:hypothetical protein
MLKIISYDEWVANIKEAHPESVNPCGECDGTALLDCGECDGDGYDTCDQCDCSSDDFENEGCYHCDGTGDVVCGCDDGKVECGYCSSDSYKYIDISNDAYYRQTVEDKTKWADYQKRQSLVK